MDDIVGKRLDVLRIIVAAMIGGLVAFSLVALFVARASTQPVDLEAAKLLYLLLVGVAVIDVPAYFVLRRRAIYTARQQLDKEGESGDPMEAAHRAYATALIMRCAMAEGLGLLGALSCFLTRDSYGLIAAGLSALFLMAQFPKRDRIEELASQFAGSMM